jgi:competence protein ComEC
MLVVISVLAWLISTPLSIYYFRTFSLLAPISSILLIPFLTVLLWTSFLRIIVGVALPGLGALIGEAPRWLAHRMIDLAEALSRFPLTHLKLSSPPLLLLFALYALFVAWAFRRKLQLKRSTFVMALPAFALTYLLTTYSVTKHDRLELTALDVGDGLACLVRLPNGKSILYDAGSIRGPSVGWRIIVPAIETLDPDGPEDVVISHANFDHFCGLVGVVDRWKTRNIWVNPFFHFYTRDNPSTEHILDYFYQNKADTKILLRERQLVGEGDVKIDVLWPPALPERSAPDANDSSLVLRISWRGRSVLLTGDIEDLPRDVLADENIRADVLVLPHHGAITPATKRFFDAVAPKFAVQSAGYRLAGKRPELEKLLDGAVLLPTYNCGAVTVTIDSEGVISSRTFKNEKVLTDHEDLDHNGSEWNPNRKKKSD